jgi:hypothetical protein
LQQELPLSHITKLDNSLHLSVSCNPLKIVFIIEDSVEGLVAFHNYVNAPKNELFDQLDHKPVKLQKHKA